MKIQYQLHLPITPQKSDTAHKLADLIFGLYPKEDDKR